MLLPSNAKVNRAARGPVYLIIAFSLGTSMFRIWHISLKARELRTGQAHAILPVVGHRCIAKSVECIQYQVHRHHLSQAAKRGPGAGKSAVLRQFIDGRSAAAHGEIFASVAA